jgi:dihydroorotase-like cyclic amidohydrolase
MLNKKQEEPMKILIKGGRIIDPAAGVDKEGDILIDKGRVVKTGGIIKDPAAKVIAAAGKIVSPGFIDMHTHLREPGREDAETIETALECAIRGGFTTVSAMPNTTPTCQTAADARFLIEKGEKTGKGHIIPIGAINAHIHRKLCHFIEYSKSPVEAFGGVGRKVAFFLGGAPPFVPHGIRG